MGKKILYSLIRIIIFTERVHFQIIFKSSKKYQLLVTKVRHTRGDKERGFHLLTDQSRNNNEAWLKAIKRRSGFGSYSLCPGFYYLLTSSRAAAKPLRTKEENHKRVADAPLLRFSPFEIPFPYLPPGCVPRGWFF